MDGGRCNAIYTKLTNWVARQLQFPAPAPGQPPSGPRYELAIDLRSRDDLDVWEHGFSRPRAANFARPKLTCPTPKSLFQLPSYNVNGQDLFNVLFGMDEEPRGDLLAAAFEQGDAAEPTRHPLRLHLLCDDDRVCALPWTRIEDRSRRLSEVGWTVELHPRGETRGFPEYPPYICYFPGKVILAGAQVGDFTVQTEDHFHDLHTFFQRRWQEAPAPGFARTADELRTELNRGSTRLIYYYGAASAEGLTFGEAASTMSWAELADLMQQSQSVSALYLNLLGESGFDAIPQGRVLLSGAKAVLMQCSERSHAESAAGAAVRWLTHVLTASPPLDPVVALHWYHTGQVAAWTAYSTWQTVAPQRIENPDLVNLLLDRHRQRNDVFGAKETFYRSASRRIYQAVAIGTAGGRAGEFPLMASQHLKLHKRDAEIYIDRLIPVTTRLTSADAVDDQVRQQFRMMPQQSVIDALLPADATSGTDFGFLMLGWVLPESLDSTESGVAVISAIADWCRTRLVEDLSKAGRAATIYVMSIVAIEAVSIELADDLLGRIKRLTRSLADSPAFDFIALDRLAEVEYADLNHYFQDRDICSCDDRYRDAFPDLILGRDDRDEIPFDLAVATIRRGDPDNWGNLYQELKRLQTSGEWPPADDDPLFWEKRDGR